MKRKLAVIILLALSTVLSVPVYSAEIQSPSQSSLARLVTIKQPDERIHKLRSYLEKHNSPLSSYAYLFVQKADEYGLPDWRLVPAITGVESTFGKHIPHSSYNAYGWANGNFTFVGWEDSIDHVTKTLKEKYYDKGRDNVEKIAPKYAPPSTTWAGKVRFFMNAIDTQGTPHVQFLSFTL